MDGRVISNAPKNDAANTMNTRKKMMFGSQCVASQLKMSAVTASPPISRVSRMMTEMGTVYRSTMKRPYMLALKRPLAAEPELFIKKDTVIGTIGKTQGVRSIAKPQSMASSIRAQMEPSLLSPLSPPDFAGVPAATAVASLTLISKS